MTQAIVTKFFGPTDTKGARIKASAQAGSVFSSYTYETSSDGEHCLAAKKLAEKLGWNGVYFGGGNPDGTGNTYVFVGDKIPAGDYFRENRDYFISWPIA
jgi:hypothetical protein